MVQWINKQSVLKKLSVCLIIVFMSTKQTYSEKSPYVDPDNLVVDIKNTQKKYRLKTISSAKDLLEMKKKLNITDIIKMKELIIFHIKNCEINKADIVKLNQILKLAFIDKDTTKIGQMLDRMQELNVEFTDQITICQLCALYTGDINSITHFFKYEKDKHKSNTNLELTQEEIGFIVKQSPEQNIDLEEIDDISFKNDKKIFRSRKSLHSINPINSNNDDMIEFEADDQLLKSDQSSISDTMKKLMILTKNPEKNGFKSHKKHKNKTVLCNPSDLADIISPEIDKFSSETSGSVILDEDMPKEKKQPFCVNNIKIALFRQIIGTAYMTFRSVISDEDNSIQQNHEPYSSDDLLDLLKYSAIIMKDLNILNHTETSKLMEIHRKLSELCDIDDIKKKYEVEYDYSKIETNICDSINQAEMITELLHHDINFNKNIKNNTSDHEHLSKLMSNIKELNRRKHALPYIPFRNRYSQLMVDKNKNVEQTKYAYIKNSFWYDIFLPELLNALSIDREFDDVVLEKIDSEPESAKIMLDDWFQHNISVIESKCQDVPNHLQHMSLKEKFIIKQCWMMTKDYFMIFRETNVNNDVNNSKYEDIELLVDLSRYIPFIDEYVGTSHVMKNTIHISLSQYIGPPIWDMLHGIAELIKNASDVNSEQFVKKFKSFFMIILRTYPCPHCRKHLTERAINNVEIFNYPLEYLLAGWKSSDNLMLFNLDIDKKLDQIITADDLRVFLWKFHNAVNSTIADYIDFNLDTIMSIIDPEQDIDSEKEETKSLSSISSSSSNSASRNSKYTRGHWPEPHMINESLRSEYESVMTIFIQKRSELLKAHMDISSNLSNEMESVVEQLNDMTNKIAIEIKKSIETIDKIILNSGLLEKQYKILDLIKNN